MDNNVVVLVAQLMVVLVPTVAALVGIGLGARLLWRKGTRDPGPPAVDDRRLERLETAVDVIAIEVERISEAQRFSAALLAERLPAPRVADIKSPTSVKRVNTPH
jgi:hypothetical protein